MEYFKLKVSYQSSNIRFFFPRHTHCYVVISWADFLIVTDQPEINVHPKAETISEGENLTLVCNATGNPAPTLSWIRDGSPVETSGRISISDDKKQLTITNVSRTDSGEYRCVANNSLGNETSNVATVDVQCKYNVL